MSDRESPNGLGGVEKQLIELSVKFDVFLQRIDTLEHKLEKHYITKIEYLSLQKDVTRIQNNLAWTVKTLAATVLSFLAAMGKYLIGGG